MITQPTAPSASPLGRCPLVLFQYGAVHEELAPSLLTASNTLGHKISVSLHAGSLRSKGDVFAAFSVESLAGHCIIYRPSGPKAPEPGDQLEALIEPLENPCALFLTLQNPWTIEIARRLQGKGIRVFGIVHNVNKVRKNRDVLSFWKEHSATPVALSSHVRANLADLINRRTEDVELLYSTFQPDLPSTTVEQEEPVATRIAIAGAINYQSRPFETLLQALASLQSQEPKVVHQLVFHLLGGGPDRSRLITEVAARGLQDSFQFTRVSKENGRSSYADYYEELSKCHYMLALDVDRYTTDKITSTVPTSVSFLKPLIATTRFFATYGLSGSGLASDDLAEALRLAALKFEFPRHVERLQEVRAEQLRHNASFVNYVTESSGMDRHRRRSRAHANH